MSEPSSAENKAPDRRNASRWIGRAAGVSDCCASIPRIPLAWLPTPVMELPRLTEYLHGPRILVKRDDLTGLASGGNKTRKLEFLLADALAQHADTLITAGGVQSNHCRQTAAAAAQFGLDCHLVLGGDPPAAPLGNLLLDGILGAHVHWGEAQRRVERMQDLAATLRSQGRVPYVIPVGGSNAVGTLGYVAAMEELTQQLAAACDSVQHIVFATSSGGTQAGLLIGQRLTGFTGQLHAISIDQPPDAESDAPFCAEVARVANAAAESLQSSVRLTADAMQVHYDYRGAGYGIVGDAERQAIRLLASLEGLLTGPVYTGRAMAGLLDLVRRRTFHPDETVLFWHTGDDVTLHAYGSQLA